MTSAVRDFGDSSAARKMRIMLATLALLAAASASFSTVHAAFERANSSECLQAGDPNVNLVDLVSALNDTVACDADALSCSRTVRATLASACLCCWSCAALLLSRRLLTAHAC